MVENIFNINHKIISGKDRNSYIQHALDDSIKNETPAIETSNVETPKPIQPVTPISSGKIIPFKRPVPPEEDNDKNDAWSDLGYIRR